MQTLLIVEDEKLIRHGIATMASRSTVSIGEIIECRNGAEALEILNSRKIDTMFMDIRMPKMDGIELIHRLDDLPDRPDVVVISGYDDFSYAVEMLKHGVFDYVLKPVKREKIDELLRNIDKKQQEKQKDVKKELQLLYRQMKFAMTSDRTDGDSQAIQHQYEAVFGDKPFRIIYSPATGDNCTKEIYSGICLENIKNQDVLLMTDEIYHQWISESKAAYYGVSELYERFSDCMTACEQAYQARLEAFWRCRSDGMVYEGQSFCEAGHTWQEDEADLFTDQFVRQLSTKDKDRALHRLSRLFFEAKHGQCGMVAALKVVTDIQRKTVEAYQAVVPEEKRELLRYEAPLSYSDSEVFAQAMFQWLDELSQCLTEEFIGDQSKRKIREAVAYIHENYQKDLNMAQVSNYVSMNYSLFSIAFKAYTGVNFVNYLKNIRIEAAKKLLQETEWKVSDIGRTVGYENVKHFMKIFKNICGVSPSDYRKMCDH